MKVIIFLALYFIVEIKVSREDLVITHTSPKLRDSGLLDECAPEERRFPCSKCMTFRLCVILKERDQIDQEERLDY